MIGGFTGATVKGMLARMIERSNLPKDHEDYSPLITEGNLLLPFPRKPLTESFSLPAKRPAAVSEESATLRLRRRIEILPDAPAVDRLD